ncbi:MAG: ferredoxin--NADP reductase [Candidatus Dojkabacteria bacterium]
MSPKGPTKISGIKSIGLKRYNADKIRIINLALLFVSIAKYKAKIVRSKQLTEKVIQAGFVIESPESLLQFSFAPGQYISFLLRDISGRKVRRSYSISSDPGRKFRGHPYIEVIVDISPAGPGSNFFRDLQPETTVEILGPMGTFLVDQNNAPSGKSIFIATGTGVAPYLPMINQLLQKKTIELVELMWGLRCEKDIYLKEKLDTLEKSSAGRFSYKIYLSQETNEHLGGLSHDYAFGRVNAGIDEGFNAGNHYYLCGNGKMIEEVSTFLLSENLLTENIKVEKYY